MDKQRLAILVCAALGMLAIFMPWTNVPFIGGINGTRSNTGWITFCIFAVPLIISLAGDRTKSLEDSFVYIVLAAGLVNAAIAIYKIVDFDNGMGSVSKDNIFADALKSSISIGFGLYLVAIAGIALPVFAFILKDKPVAAANQS